MDILNKKENKLVFKAEVEDSLMNAIRRYVNKVPVLAIDTVEIIQNGSALYDEVIAHRLGLIPLKKDPVLMGKTKGILKLKTDKEGVVQSGELKGNAELIYNEVPITYLNKGQELELNAYTGVGIGSDHVKFSPGLMFYRTISELTLDKNFLTEVKKICPNANIKEKGEKIIIVDDQEKEILDACEGLLEGEGKKVETSLKEGLIVSIESFGQIEAKEIFNGAINVLKKDLAEVSKKLK